ncbi:MAG: hypothetical protein QOJ59_1180 [Thermomicrobiales bacterium]|jgi:hypothetical protein|nr:hypothetical protein [Thermomicrobiales bacterium]
MARGFLSVGNRVAQGSRSSKTDVGAVEMIASESRMRGHRLAPALVLAPSLYSVYYAVSLVTGEQDDRYPGNNQKVCPLSLGLIPLGGVISAKTWSELRAAELLRTGCGWT